MNNIVITAGPTREPIDPVRFISNYSSGKMGYAIAAAAAESGAKVTLISGPTCLNPPKDVKLTNVITAKEMYDAVMQEINACDIFIATAAVADYRPDKVATHKIKKTPEALTIKLVPNPDILTAVAVLPDAPFTVGFAAETENILENARIKLQQKKVDMIIANQVGPEQGFDQEENELFILQRDQETIKLPLAKKTILAKKIIEILNYQIEKVK